jgi:hypothetical protein
LEQIRNDFQTPFGFRKSRKRLMFVLLFSSLLEAHAHTHLPPHLTPKVEAHLNDAPLERAHAVHEEVDGFFKMGTKKKTSKTFLGAEKTVIKNKFLSDDGKSSGKDKSTLIEKKDGTTEVRRSVTWHHPSKQKVIETKVKAVQTSDGSTRVKSHLKIREETEFRGVPTKIKESVSFESKQTPTGQASSLSTTSYQLKAVEHQELNMKMKETIQFEDESKPGTFQEQKNGKTRTYFTTPKEKQSL